MSLLLCALCTLSLATDLQLLIQEAEQQDPNLNMANAVSSEKKAAVETAQADFLPTAKLSADSGPRRTYEWKSRNQVSKTEGWTWNHQLSGSANWNLLNGGLSQNKNTATQNDLELAALDLQKARSELYSRIFSKIVALDLSNQKVTLRKAQLSQAQELQSISQRKSKSGFFGRKELLEAQRETARAEVEWFNAKKDLERQIFEFNLETHLNRHFVTLTKLAELTANLKKILIKEMQNFSENPLIPNLASEKNSIALSSANLTAQNTAIESASMRVSRWSPSLDLSMGGQYVFLDNSNLESAQKSLSPDRRFTPYAQLSLSVNVFAPTASAKITELAERELTQKIRTERVLSELQINLKKVPDQLKNLKETLQMQSRLIALSEELLQVNKRLFDAGVLDLRSVIISTQELSNQKEKSVDLEQKSYELGLTLVKALHFGLTP
jgi:outer membrane protein TolC